MRISRRALLGTAAGSVGAGLLSASALGWSPVEAKKSGRWAKNIIFCVVDGMPLSCLSIADDYLRLNTGKPSYWAWLLGQPGVVNGYQATRSLSSVVTDSAAAASTWGSGRRVWNGMLNMFPDKTKLATLTQQMNAAGVKCGLVTTTRMTHATPAGFSICAIQRDLEDLIAEEYLTSGVDVLMGGGLRNFDPAKRKDGKDVLGLFRQQRFKVVTDAAGMHADRSEKVLGLFQYNHLPYEVDRLNSKDLSVKVPSLADMAKSALDRLKGSKEGFLLQIEGGRVDHGGHSNDLAAMLYDQIAFEDAVRVAMEFALHDGETLVIITADHACGGLALNGDGDEYFDSNAGLESMAGLKASYDVLTPMLKNNMTARGVQSVFEEKLALKISDSEAVVVLRALAEDYEFGESVFFQSLSSTLGMVIGNHTKCTFTSGNHHSDHVIVTAYGPGAHRCHGLVDNTDFNRIMLEAKSLSNDNPTMTFEQAAPLMDKLRDGTPRELFELYGEHDECSCSDHRTWNRPRSNREIWSNHSR
ncbi:alkaline phosphatase [Kamptonema cortianum]|nr:alkaline phosphatase [Geitlerinema splendidum]MDK3158764.1 alkaline phosphatase [Kamptonema cortianum]